MQTDLNIELESAKKAALKMGKVQLKCFRKPLKVNNKSPTELVSDVDMKCQDIAFELLGKLSHPILSEEKQYEEDDSKQYLWIVDPLDGTHNYVTGVPLFGVSIGLAKLNEFILGVIYLPIFGELFWATKNKGAFLNGKQIHVNSNINLRKSMVAYDNQFFSNKYTFDRYKKLVKHTFTTRISGSAVCDLSSVARGILDARIFNKTKIVDFAAGAVIVQESGGQITNFNNNQINKHSKAIIASNGNVHDELLKILGGEHNDE